MSALPVSSMDQEMDALSRYRAAERDILDRITSYASQISEAQERIHNVSRAAEVAEKKLAAIRDLIALEEQGPELPTAQQLTLAVAEKPAKSASALRRFEPQAFLGGDPNTAKVLSAQWQAFVEDRLYERGCTTVDALYLEAPAEWRTRFEGVPSKLSGLFRARRLLRRSTTFEVDRDTGMVTMVASATPKVPPFLPGDPIVTAVNPKPDSDGRFVIVQYPEETLEIDYALFKAMLAQGKHAWMRDKDQSLVPLAIKRFMSRKSRISSYDDEDWTTAWNDFAKIS